MQIHTMIIVLDKVNVHTGIFSSSSSSMRAEVSSPTLSSLLSATLPSSRPLPSVLLLCFLTSRLKSVRPDEKKCRTFLVSTLQSYNLYYHTILTILTISTDLPSLTLIE